MKTLSLCLFVILSCQAKSTTEASKPSFDSANKNESSELFQDTSEGVVNDPMEKDSPINHSLADIAKDSVITITSKFYQTDVKVEGSYTMQYLNGNLKIDFSSDFYADSGPDLFIILVKKPSAQIINYQFDSLKEDEKKILAGPTNNFKSWSKTIPMTLEEARQYQSIIIQCVEWNHLYAKAPMLWP